MLIRINLSLKSISFDKIFQEVKCCKVNEGNGLITAKIASSTTLDPEPETTTRYEFVTEAGSGMLSVEERLVNKVADFEPEPVADFEPEPEAGSGMLAAEERLANKVDHFIDNIRKIFLHNYIISKVEAISTNDFSVTIDRLVSKIDFSSNDVMARFTDFQDILKTEIASVKFLLTNHFNDSRYITFTQVFLFLIAGFCLGFIVSSATFLYIRPVRIITQDRQSIESLNQQIPDQFNSFPDQINSLPASLNSANASTYCFPRSCTPSLNSLNASTQSLPECNQSSVISTPVRPRLTRYFQSSSSNFSNQSSVENTPERPAFFTPIRPALLTEPLVENIPVRPTFFTPIRPNLLKNRTLSVISQDNRPSASTGFIPFRFTAFSRYQSRFTREEISLKTIASNKNPDPIPPNQNPQNPNPNPEPSESGNSG